MAITAIPGFNVQKVGKDKYSVSVNNGNMGAVLLNKEQLKEFADVYGVPVKDNSKTKKAVGLAAAGLALVGAITAGVVYRKNIAKAFKNLKEIKPKEVLNTIKTKTVDAAGKVKETTVNAARSVKEKGSVWYNKAADFAKRAWKNIKGFFGGGFEKLKGLFKSAGQEVNGARPRDAKGRFVKVK